MVPLTRRQFMQAGAAAIASLPAGRLLAGAPAGRRPNVVFVFADQMRAHAMGCMGNTEILTPHLDRMAAQGILVTNGISCTPLCSPYRAQLLTGRYGHATDVITNDVRLNDRETVISEIMKAQGYATGYIGKWHLTGGRGRRNPVDARNRRGWDFWAVRNCSHEHFKPEYWLNDAKAPTAVDGWEPDVQTDLAAEFIRQRRTGPFCLFVSYGPPHNPYKAPPEYEQMYRGRRLRGRPNGSSLKVLPSYYAMVTSLDACVGRIQKALADAGVADSTILCFSSDHGDMLGSHGKAYKQWPEEESINVPFIIRWPEKIAPGQRKDWIVSSVDVMPTLLGLCGIDVPRNVHGMDLSATVLGTGKAEREAAFLFVHSCSRTGPGFDWRGLRMKRWTYACNSEGDWVLYDLVKDPYQNTNLVDSRAHAAVVQELRRRVDAIRREVGEAIPLRNSEQARADARR